MVSIVMPELLIVCIIWFPAPFEYPERFGEPEVAVQVKVVKGTLECNCILDCCCEQMVWAGGVKYTSGEETTVTMKSVTIPSQPLACGVK